MSARGRGALLPLAILGGFFVLCCAAGTGGQLPSRPTVVSLSRSVLGPMSHAWRSCGPAFDAWSLSHIVCPSLANSLSPRIAASHHHRIHCHHPFHYYAHRHARSYYALRQIRYAVCPSAAFHAPLPIANATGLTKLPHCHSVAPLFRPPHPSHQSSRACLLAHVAMPCPWIHRALPCWAIAWLVAHTSHSSIEHLIPCATLNVACRPHDWPRARHSSGAHLAKPNPMALSSSRIVLAAASLHERQSEACTIGVQARA